MIDEVDHKKNISLREVLKVKFGAAWDSTKMKRARLAGQASTILAKKSVSLTLFICLVILWSWFVYSAGFSARPGYDDGFEDGWDRGWADGWQRAKLENQGLVDLPS